jgi:hypothetical protein
MGIAISAMRNALKAGDDAEAVKSKQNLEILQKLVDAQLDKYEAALDAAFLNPTAAAKTEVPGIRALRKQRFSTANVSDKPSDKIGDAIDSFFNIGGEGVKTDDALRVGFKSVVKGALDAFLGNTESGQKEESKYFVYMYNNAVVRLDVKLWRWNFAGKGFSDNYQSVFGYFTCMSVVDVKALKTSEFVFLITEYVGGKGEEATKYIDEMTKLYTRARKFAKEEEGNQA